MFLPRSGARVGGVAAECGLDDLSGFTWRFRAALGARPTDSRHCQAAMPSNA